MRRRPRSTLFPYTTLFRSVRLAVAEEMHAGERSSWRAGGLLVQFLPREAARAKQADLPRSEEHTSELQSRRDLVCRLLLEKKKYASILLRSCHDCARPGTC